MRAELEKEFIRQYSTIKGKPVPPFSLQFYPYSNLTNTIRIRNGMILLRFSDILRSAPDRVLAATIAILLHKLFRRKVPGEHNQIYDRYTNRRRIMELTHKTRRERGRKQITSPQGRCYDLRRMFDDLNERYFRGRVRVRVLSWSRRRSRRILGHFDSAHRAIIIDRRLDSYLVPRYVIRYVLYHEMLHAYLGEELHNGRRHVHHPRFRRVERLFPDYTRAVRFIEQHL